MGLYVNFDKYIGRVKNASGNKAIDADPGAYKAIKHFYKKKREMISKIGSKKSKNEAKDYKDLQDFLEDNFFGDKSGSLSKEIIKEYNKEHSVKITPNMNIGDIQYYTEGSLSKKFNKAKQSGTLAAKKRRKIDSELLTMKFRIDGINKEFNNVLNSITGKGSKQTKDKLIRLKERSKVIWDETEKLYNELKNDYLESINKSENDLTGLEQKELNRYIKNYNRIIHNKKNKRSKKEIDSLTNSLKASEELYTLISAASKGTPKTLVGDVVEYGLEILKRDMHNTVENFTNQSIKELIAGKQSVERGGSKIKGGEDGAGYLYLNQSLGSSESKMVTDKNGNEHFQIDFGGVKFYYDSSSYNTGVKKQAKCDIEFTNDFAKDTFKISAKNWTSIFADSNDLSNASILGAIDRTFGQETLQHYSFVMQHPKDNRRPMGTAALLMGHYIARLAILIDVVMGISQKENSADTLVIVDRSAKRVYVIDIIEELLNILNKFDNMVSDDLFYVDNNQYDGESIETAAIAIREKVMKNISKGNLRSDRYLNILYGLLNYRRVCVKVNATKLHNTRK